MTPQLSWFSTLAAVLNFAGFALYLKAQFQQQIRASAVNLMASLLIVIGVFLSEQALSSTQASLSYSVGIVSVLLSLLLSLRHPVQWVRSDAVLLLCGAVFLALSHWFPTATAAGAAVYYLVNYTSYVSKVRRGLAQEWWLPWAVWVLAALSMLLGMRAHSVWAWLNPSVNLLCWSAVGLVVWRQRGRAVLQPAAAS